MRDTNLSDANIQMTKQQILINVITDFSKNYIEDLDNYYKLLEEVYSDDFRHSYSDITANLIRLDNEDNDAIDKIAFNFYAMLDHMSDEEVQKNETLFRRINKLYDHIALEQIRLKQVYRESKEVAQAAREQSEQATNTLRMAQNLAKESAATKTEVIAILGIFSAILLTFVGGMTFLSSVFQNLHVSSVYRIVLAILLVGFVLINALYGLFYCISLILHRKANEENDKEVKTSPLVIGNTLIVVFIVLTVLAWRSGVVEKREVSIEQKIQQLTEEPQNEAEENKETWK